MIALMHAPPAVSGGGMGHEMMVLVFQLAVIVIAARTLGFVFMRWLKLPAVLGELTAGMIIGPFALGGIHAFGIGPLFGEGAFGFPVTSQLYGLATVGSIVLLFFAGLETDLVAFLRYSVVGTLVGLFGVLSAYFLGAGCAIWFGVCDSLLAPQALFLGTVSTATSVGITARILSDKGMTDAPEGVTILAGAVVDDVLCILILAIAVGLSRSGGDAADFQWGEIGWLALKTISFWLVSMVFSLKSAPLVSRILKLSDSHAAAAVVVLGLAMILAGLTEKAGLAMIIGAYVSGLAFSRTDLVEVIQEELKGLYGTVVPIFFCVMGMLVDFSAMGDALVFGIVFTVLAIVGKVCACAAPAWMTKFNLRGSLRIGVGMMPRGEVALVVAGIGLSSGILDKGLFGVVIMMTAVTTLLAPPVLIQLLEGGTGLKKKVLAATEPDQIVIQLPMSVPELAEMVGERIVRAFRSEGFFVHRVSEDRTAYRFRLHDMIFKLHVEDADVLLSGPPRYADLARLIAMEELLEFQGIAAGCEKISNLNQLGTDLATSVFRGSN